MGGVFKTALEFEYDPQADYAKKNLKYLPQFRAQTSQLSSLLKAYKESLGPAHVEQGLLAVKRRAAEDVFKRHGHNVVLGPKPGEDKPEELAKYYETEKQYEALVEQYRDEIENTFRAKLLHGLEVEKPNAVRLQRMFDEGLGDNLENVIQPLYAERKEDLKQSKPIYPTVAEVAAKLFKDKDIPLEQKALLFPDTKGGKFVNGYMRDYDDPEIMSRGRILEDTKERISELAEPTYGVPDTRSEVSGIDWVVEKATTTGRMTGGAVVGALESIRKFGATEGKSLEDEIYERLPDKETRDSNTDAGSVLLMNLRGQRTPVDIGKSSDFQYGRMFQSNFWKGLGEILSDAEKMGATLETIQEYSTTAAKKPGTKGDWLAFVDRSLRDVRSAAYRKAYEELGLTPEYVRDEMREAQSVIDQEEIDIMKGKTTPALQFPTPESMVEGDMPWDEIDPLVNLINDRAKEIAEYAIQQDPMGSLIKNEIIGRFLVEGFTDPVTYAASPLIKLIGKGIGLASRGVKALAEGLKTIEKVPAIPKSVRALEEAVTTSADWTRLKKAQASGKVRDFLEWGWGKVEMGYVPQAMEMTTIAEKTKLLHKQLAKDIAERPMPRRTATVGDDLSDVAQHMIDEGAESVDDYIAMAQTASENAEKMGLVLRNAPLKAPGLRLRVKKMYEINEKIKKKLPSDDLQELLWRYREKEPGAIDDILALPEEVVGKLLDADKLATKLAKEHKEWRKIAGLEHGFDPETGAVVKGGEIPAETYQPHVFWGDFEKMAAGGESWSPRFNMGRAPKSSLERTGAKGYVRNFHTAWTLTLNNSAGRKAMSGAQTKLIAEYAQDLGFMKIFKKGDKQAAETYRKVKSALHGQEWVDVEDFIRTRAGGEVTNTSDFITRTTGHMPAQEGENIIMAPRSVAKSIHNSIMLGADKKSLYDAFMRIVGPYQSTVRKGMTIASPEAFPLSQAASAPFIAYHALGLKGLDPKLQMDSAKVAYYVAMKVRGVFDDHRLMSKLMEMPGFKSLLPDGKQLMKWEDGAKTLDEVADIIIGDGAFSYGGSRYSGDVMSSRMVGGELKELSAAEKAWRKPGQAMNALPTVLLNDIIDTQQRVTMYLGTLKKINDPFDRMRAAEFARRWSFGMGREGRGGLERALSDNMMFGNFVRFGVSTVAETLSRPQLVGRLAMQGRLRQAENEAYGRYVPVDLESLGPFAYGKTIAHPSLQPKELVNSTAERLSDAPITLRMKEDMFQLWSSPLAVLGMIAGGTDAREAAKETARSLGPAIDQGLATILQYDTYTRQQIESPFFPDREVDFMYSGAGKLAFEAAGLPRIVREVRKMFEYMNKDTPLERMDAFTKLGAYTTWKITSDLMRYLNTGEWNDSMSGMDYALTFLDRFYPANKLSNAVRERREGLDAAGRQASEVWRMQKDTSVFNPNRAQNWIERQQTTVEDDVP